MSKTAIAISTETSNIVSRKSHFMVSSTNIVFGWLGDGIVSRLFWVLIRTGAIDAAVTILIVGYIASHFDITIRETIRRILIS